jgi:hypothetical protein
MASLGWSAEQAWTATPHEILDAFDGYRRINDPDYRRDEGYREFAAGFAGKGANS